MDIRRVRQAVTGALVVSLMAVTACSSSKGTARHSTTSTAPSGRGPKPTVVASGLVFPAGLAFDAHGGMWFSSSVSRGRNASDGVWYVPKGGAPRHVVSISTPSGIAWVGDQLYVAQLTAPGSGRVLALSGFDGRHFASQRVVISGIPTGEHTIGSIAPGPDGRLYIGTGAAAALSGPSGTILSFAPAGGATSVRAKGVRSAYGLAFHGRDLLVTDTGRDDLGALRPPEELNEFDPTGPVVDFGYSRCYNQGGASCAGTRAPLVLFAAHASPTQVAVKGDVAYVAENGSSFVQNPTGADIQRVDLRTGQHTVFWRSPVKHDPLGLAIGPDGDLYLTLIASGEIVRFTL